MKDFGFYKSIRFAQNNKLRKAFSKLHCVYHLIPDTKGCLENMQEDGGCGAWCCQIQTPQILYSEFLLIWSEISRKWDDDDICGLIEKCMMCSVRDIPSKGCIFFDKGTKLCCIHRVRSYNCRIYGITPEEEFQPRYKKLKEEYKDIIGAVIKPQCGLVSTIDKREVTIKDTNEWWDKLVGVERSIGLPMRLITDEIGGSYRTPHDHVLLYTMPENVLNALAGIRMYEEHQQKIIAVKEIVSCISNFFKGFSNGKTSKS